MDHYSIKNGKIFFSADIKEKLSDFALKRPLKRRNCTEWRTVLSTWGINNPSVDVVRSAQKFCRNIRAFNKRQSRSMAARDRPTDLPTNSHNAVLMHDADSNLSTIDQSSNAHTNPNVFQNQYNFNNQYNVHTPQNLHQQLFTRQSVSNNPNVPPNQQPDTTNVSFPYQYPSNYQNQSQNQFHQYRNQHQSFRNDDNNHAPFVSQPNNLGTSQSNEVSVFYPSSQNLSLALCFELCKFSRLL